ncbi:MAG: hypothetical protein ACUVR3_11420 [Candidatus Roseilinea sp.]|uniref:hypothetical protein n=1 Tax=Candidatus Roseilinea sp. TaxID=2838777 RepID=UPI00404BA247
MPYARKDLLTWERGMYYHIYNRGAHQLSITPALGLELGTSKPKQTSIVELFRHVGDFCWADDR